MGGMIKSKYSFKSTRCNCWEGFRLDIQLDDEGYDGDDERETSKRRPVVNRYLCYQTDLSEDEEEDVKAEEHEPRRKKQKIQLIDLQGKGERIPQPPLLTLIHGATQELTRRNWNWHSSLSGYTQPTWKQGLNAAPPGIGSGSMK